MRLQVFLNLIFRGRHRTSRQGLLGVEVPGEIKSVTVERLLELGSAAEGLGYSATGRPVWTDAHKGQIKAVFLMPLGFDGSVGNPRSCWRCYAGVVVQGIGIRTFTVDVAMDDFAALTSVVEPWEIAESVLYWAQGVPLDGTV